jgi:hypothetical protein
MSRPRIDAFGNIQIGPGPAHRARVIQTGNTTFAIFPEHAEPAPYGIVLASEPRKKGRMLLGELIGDETVDFVFQRAGCSCQTPAHLKGPARKFLALLEPVNA